MAICRAHGVPVLPRGAGTSIAGQAVNAAVVLDFTTHLNRVLEIDPKARIARVEPGVVCDVLCDAASPYGLTFGPDPSTHNRCTLGGMIGNNACGSHSVAWGKTVDNVHTLDVLSYRGERSEGVGPSTPDHGPIPDALRKLAQRLGSDVRELFPELTRRVSGYNLDQLLPEYGFSTWPGRWSAPRVPASPCSARPSGWCSRRRSVRWPCSGFPQTRTPQPTTS